MHGTLHVPSRSLVTHGVRDALMHAGRFLLEINRIFFRTTFPLLARDVYDEFQMLYCMG